MNLNSFAFCGLIFLAASSPNGCGPPNTNQTAEAIPTAEEHQIRLRAEFHLPGTAKNIKVIDIGWFTFELDNKKFLAHMENPYSTHAVYTITQIVD